MHFKAVPIYSIWNSLALSLPNLETVARTFKVICVRDDEKLNQNHYISNGAEGSEGMKKIELTELG